MNNSQITHWCHEIIKSQAPKGGFYIDATMGKGNDTLFFCELAGGRTMKKMSRFLQKKSFPSCFPSKNPIPGKVLCMQLDSSFLRHDPARVRPPVFSFLLFFQYTIFSIIKKAEDLIISPQLFLFSLLTLHQNPRGIPDLPHEYLRTADRTGHP